jgi:hypothetical protein
VSSALIRARQIKMPNVLLVQENEMQIWPTCIAYRHPPAILPLLAARNINEQRSDEEGIFPLDRGAHSRQKGYHI